MSSSEDKNPKKSKRSFIPKLPSFRRKKNNPSQDHGTPSKSASKSKKHRNENSSNTKTSIAKETQTPKTAPSIYQDKSTSQVVDTYKCLTELKEEEQNGNDQSKVRTALSNINTTSVFTTSTATTCFINPEYDGDVWHLQNQNTEKDVGIHGNSDQEINANINEKRPDSPSHIIPLSPVKTKSFQHIGRCSSVTSTLSSGSSLSLSSPGSLTKLIGGPKPYKSVFTDEPRGVKRQGSTPSDLDITSSCVSVSGSVSSLSPTIDDVATKVTVKSCSVPGLHKYPVVAPVESLSPGVSPKHTHSKREGAYTYDSSGWESEDSSKEKTLTRGSYDINNFAEKSAEDAPTPHSLVNLNFDLQAAAAASPQINANLRRERQKALASKAKSAVGVQSQKPVTEQQESPSSAGARREEAPISPHSAASASSGPTNNNPASDSRHEALIQPTETHVGSDSCSALAQRQKSTVRTPRTAATAPITPQHSTPCSHTNNAGQTAGQDQEKSDEVVLTRVRSVTSPVPLKTSRALYALSHIQLSAMRNKLRSESFDSSDLDSLASDDLMCEADNTFLDPSDESNLTQGNSMPGEQGFSPYPNTGKGKRLRNNSIEFLVASFDKRHRHHSTGQNYGPYSSNSPRGNLRTIGSGQAAGRDTILVEASTYRQMVQDLNSMKTALGKLSKMLQDPKALQEMLAVCQPQQEPSAETADNMTQCEQVPVQEGEAQTDNVQGVTKVSAPAREASSQSEGIQRADRAVQSDVTFTTLDGHSTDSSDGQDAITRGVSTKNNSKISRIKAAFEEYMALHGTYHVQGCKQCEECFTTEGKQGDADVITERSEVTASSFRSREGCLSISSSSSGGEEGVLREPWRGSSGLDQVTLSPLGNSLSSGDTSDDNATRLDRQKHAKPHRKHVRISDQGSDGSGTGRLKLPSQRGSSLPRMNREKGSSSEEIGEVCSSRLKHPQSRLGLRGKLASPRVGHERCSSSDEGTGSGGRLVCRQRNESDSSHEGSEGSGSLGEKSKLPQMRRPTSRMQRPRQIQRPKTGQQQGRKADGKMAVDCRGNPTSRLQKPMSYHKGDGRQHQEQEKVPPQEQQGSLEWQQLQLQQQQDKLHRQHQAAHKQQQENQQRLHNQQQQLQKDQQEKVTANLQKQQEILVEQQQQQFKRQQQLQQQHMWQHQQQKSQELAMPKFARPQGVLTKRSSNQDLTSSQRRSPETVKTTQEMRHSSPDLIDNKLSSSQHTATVHSQEKQNGTDKQSPKSRLPAPASRLPSSRQATNGAVKRDVSNPAQTKNIANGIPVHKSKMPSPKSPRRTIPTGNVSKIQKASPPPERRVPGVTNQRQPGVQLHCNQNNNPTIAPRGQHLTTTLTTTTTTVTTTTLPQASSGAQVSKLPSPVKSNLKPASRLAQPKVKVQSKIPKGSGIPLKSRDAN